MCHLPTHLFISKCKNNYLMAECNQQKRKIKSLRKKSRRRDSKIHDAKELINKLKRQLLVKTEQAVLFHNHSRNLQLSLLVNSMKKWKCTPKKRRYTQELKEFALTLYFYSPRAYNYFRSIFHLPHPSLLRK